MCTFTDETPRQSTSSDVTCCQDIYLDITYSFVHFLLIVLMSHHVFMIPMHYPHIGTLCNNSNIRMNVNPIHMVALLTKKQQLFQMYEVLKTTLPRPLDWRVISPTVFMVPLDRQPITIGTVRKSRDVA